MAHLEKILASTDTDETQRMAAEHSHKASLVEIQLLQLTRKVNVLNRVQGTIEKENMELKKSLTRHKEVDTEKIVALEGNKEVLDAQLLHLVQELNNSVPKPEYEKLVSQHSALLSKHQEQNQRERDLIVAVQETYMLR